MRKSALTSLQIAPTVNRTAGAKYSMGFTTGGLLLSESTRMAEVFLAVRDWTLVRQKIIGENLLQSRTTSTSIKLCREITSRLRLLSDRECELLVHGLHREKCGLLWIALCKRYQFIFDFALEVLHEKYVQHNLSVTVDDYDAFFAGKSQWHPELTRLTSQTQAKIRQVLLKALRDADLVDRENVINPFLATDRFTDILSDESKTFLVALPISDVDLRRYCK